MENNYMIMSWKLSVKRKLSVLQVSCKIQGGN
jgi:hypothetical protein